MPVFLAMGSRPAPMPGRWVRIGRGEDRNLTLPSHLHCLSRIPSLDTRNLYYSYPLISFMVLSTTPQLTSIAPVHARPQDRSDNDERTTMDVAVFRFTLGIPGFDDALIPRVIGILCLCLIVLNHVTTSEDASSPAQIRMEVLGTALSAIAMAAPTAQRRLEEASPGKGRRAMIENVEGGSNVFAIEESLPRQVQEDLAWASFALLKNCNICGVFAVWRGKAVMCRGTLGSMMAVPDSALALSTFTATWSAFDGKMDVGSALAGTYLDNRQQLDRYRLRDCPVIPKGAGSVLMLPIVSTKDLASRGSGVSLRPVQGLLVLVSDTERSVSLKEQRWAEGVASKLYQSLMHRDQSFES